MSFKTSYTLYVSKDFRALVKIEAAKRNIKEHQLIEEAVYQFLKGETDAKSV